MRFDDMFTFKQIKFDLLLQNLNKFNGEVAELKSDASPALTVSHQSSVRQSQTPCFLILPYSIAVLRAAEVVFIMLAVVVLLVIVFCVSELIQ
jgi:hypothetical protein